MTRATAIPATSTAGRSRCDLLWATCPNWNPGSGRGFQGTGGVGGCQTFGEPQWATRLCRDRAIGLLWASMDTYLVAHQQSHSSRRHMSLKTLLEIDSIVDSQSDSQTTPHDERPSEILSTQPRRPSNRGYESFPHGLASRPVGRMRIREGIRLGTRDERWEFWAVAEAMAELA